MYYIYIPVCVDVNKKPMAADYRLCISTFQWYKRGKGATVMFKYLICVISIHDSVLLLIFSLYMHIYYVCAFV